jgi:hypothetical protein
MSRAYFPIVPKWWLDRAAIEAKESYSTGACYIGSLIWLQSKLAKNTAGLKLPVMLLKKAGFGRYYIATSLRVLENAGLITVQRFDHKSPEITLITSQAEAERLATIRSRSNGHDKKA